MAVAALAICAVTAARVRDRTDAQAGTVADKRAAGFPFGHGQREVSAEPMGYCWVMRDPEGNEFCVQ